MKTKLKISTFLFDITFSLFFYGIPVFVNLLVTFGQYIPEDTEKYPFLFGIGFVSLIVVGLTYSRDKQDTRIEHLEKELERIKNETIHSSK